MVIFTTFSYACIRIKHSTWIRFFNNERAGTILPITLDIDANGGFWSSNRYIHCSVGIHIYTEETGKAKSTTIPPLQNGKVNKGKGKQMDCFFFPSFFLSPASFRFAVQIQILHVHAHYSIFSILLTFKFRSQKYTRRIRLFVKSTNACSRIFLIFSVSNSKAKKVAFCRFCFCPFESIGGTIHTKAAYTPAQTRAARRRQLNEFRSWCSCWVTICRSVCLSCPSIHTIWGKRKKVERWMEWVLRDYRCGSFFSLLGQASHPDHYHCSFSSWGVFLGTGRTPENRLQRFFAEELFLWTKLFHFPGSCLILSFFLFLLSCVCVCVCCPGGMCEWVVRRPTQGCKTAPLNDLWRLLGGFMHLVRESTPCIHLPCMNGH